MNPRSGVSIGVDVLGPEEDASEDDGEPLCQPLDVGAMEGWRVTERAVPSRSLKVTYAPAEAGSADEIRVPILWMVRR